MTAPVSRLTLAVVALAGVLGCATGPAASPTDGAAGSAAGDAAAGATGDADVGQLADGTADSPDAVAPDTVKAPEAGSTVPGDGAAAADSSAPSDAETSDGGAPSTVATPKPPAGVALVDLGTHAHAAGVKTLGPFTVTVPAGTWSMAINLVGTTGVTYGLASLTSPSKVALVADGWTGQNVNLGGQMCLSCKLRIAPQISASAVLLPNSPDVAVEPGTYTFQVFMRVAKQASPFQPPTYSYPAGAVQVSVLTKGGAAASLPKTGTLDVNLYFTGAKGITAAKGPTDKLVQTWLATLKTIYQQAGLSVGSVTYNDLDSQYQVVEGAGGAAAGDFEEVAALTAQGPWGVNLVFVGKIASPFGGFGAVLGIAGGLPGPVGVQGTGRSAVLVATDVQLPGGQAAGADVGLTMAHELGHYLGLFHSSENDFGGFQPAIHDPIDDTPVKDATNLMYWDGSKAGTAVSPQQGAVLRHNPWVRHPQGATP